MQAGRESIQRYRIVRVPFFYSPKYESLRFCVFDAMSYGVCQNDRGGDDFNDGRRRKM
jgi:hypothetical protein